MGMAFFLGTLAVLMLVAGSHEGRSTARHCYALMALLIVGCFLAWALDRGFLT